MNLEVGDPLTSSTSLLLFADACQSEWGTYQQKMILAGSWTKKEVILHINVLEMRAFPLMQLAFFKHPMGNTMALITDGVTMVKYLNK